MDLFTGWPFYEPRRCWDEPSYGGYYGARSHPSMMRRPGYYDHPWYSETSCSPFHRPNNCSSPFYRRNPTPFDNIFDADGHPRRVRTCVTPGSSTERPNDPQLGREECVDESEKPIDTMDETATSSTESGDKTTNLTSAQSTLTTGKVPEQHTPEAMESQSQQPANHEGPTMDSSPPEINKIAEIMKKTVELQEKISAYGGVPGSKDYIYIEESLVAVLLQLDKIETNGNVDIRKARKSAVCQVQQMLTDLENKAESNMVATETAKEDGEAVVTDDASEVEQPSAVTTLEQEKTSTVTDQSDSTDLPAVEEAACGAVTVEADTTDDNVGSSLTMAVTSSSEEESTNAGDEHSDAVETVMDCTSDDTSHEDSMVNTGL